MSNEIEQTKQWLETIIIGLNFCPFAKKEWLNNTIHYYVSKQNKTKIALSEVIDQCNYLQQHDEIETSLLIFDQGFKRFENFLDLLAYAEELLVLSGFEGIFQIASFHPDYYFANEDFGSEDFEGEHIDDAANYTNRSPYPTLHLIREESMTRVLNTYQDPEAIPDNNIALAREKGAAFFEGVLKQIKEGTN